MKRRSGHDDSRTGHHSCTQAADRGVGGGETTLTEVGTVVEVGDGIATIHGLSKVGFGELLEFPSGLAGLALNLEEDLVGARSHGFVTPV